MKIYCFSWPTLCLALLFYIPLNSQITFQKTFGGAGDDVANWVANTATGYMAAGYTSAPNGNRDGYLLNLDPAGNILWQKRIGGNASDQFNVVMETGGGFLVLGETESYGAGGGDVWLLKISSAGTILWSKTIGDAQTLDLGNSMIPVSGDRILISGAQASIGSTSYNSCFYLLDNTGQVIWSHTYLTNGIGNLIRTNYVDNGVIYASGGIETEGGFLRIDLETGNPIDNKIYPGNSTEALYYLQPAADGNLLLCDHTWSATNGSEMKQWVNKVTREGQTIWSKVYSRPNGNLRGRIEAAGDDNFLLTPYDGLFSSNGDAILMKIDGDGNIMWSRNYGRPGLDWLWKSQLTPDGGFISVGSATNANGNRDVLVVKTDSEGLVAGCCIPKAGVVAQNYAHADADIALSIAPWALSVPVTPQQVNANLQPQAYCGNLPVEVFNDIGLCEYEFFTFEGVDYYAPDEIVDTLPGLFGCDTLIHYSLLLLPQVVRTEHITFCPGDPVFVNGQTYTEPDTVVIHIPSISACDTIYTYYLTYDTVPGNCTGCKGTFLKIVGDPGQDVQGHGVYDAGDGNLYVTGTKQDSALLLKMTPSGNIIWSRTFDILPSVADNIAEIMVDSDGMIAGCGQSGDEQPIAAGFAFRYDPVANTMLWTQLITTGSPFVMGIMEKSPGGNYILNSNPHQPANNAQLTEISRATGAVVPGPITKILDVGSADNFNSTMIYNGKLYGVGRFTGGNQFTDMRHTVARMDLVTGQLDYIELSHFFIGPPARLYGMDFVIRNNTLVSVGYGDETGDDLNNSRIFMHFDGLQTGTGGLHRIDLQATTSDAVDEIVRVQDGYILLCHSLFNAPADLFLVKVSDGAQIVWAKKIDYNQDQLLPVSIVQSQILAKGSFLYCVATTTNALGEKRMMILKISQDGTMDGDCHYLSDTPVTAELIPFSSGQGVIPVETPVADTFEPVQVAVAGSTPASEFLCRQLVDDQVTLMLCEGDSILLGGQVYAAPDTVVVTLSTTTGCDSIITYILQPLPHVTEVYNDVALCPGEAFHFDGIDYYAPGEVVDTLSSVSGCDSLVHYGLLLLPHPAEVFNDIGLCPNEPFHFGGIDYYAPREVVDTLQSVYGCDSIVHYGLILLPTPAEVFNDIGLCPNEAFHFGGINYYAPGEVTDTLQSVYGCDSIVHYGLLLLPQPTRSASISLCPGESVVINGHTYTQPGTVVDTIAALTGCDTIVTYTLTSILPAPSVVSIHCPANISLIADPGTTPMAVSYNLPTAETDCPCPGLTLGLTAGIPPGGGFPNGLTQVCYTAKDSCGHSASCCFTVNIREIQPCDVKVNGCIRYELLSITADADQNLTYRIRVINNCTNKLIYTAIQLPDGVVALEPDHLSVFTSENNRAYDVRNPNYSPFYSIRFKSTNDSIANGQSDIFKYTLPAQTAPTYIDITSRLAPQVFYEAHMNTFYCPIGVTPSGNRNGQQEAPAAPPLVLYPNPTDGVLWVEMAGREAQNIHWRIFNGQGQNMMQGTAATTEEKWRVDLAEGMPDGLYFIEMTNGTGLRETARFVLQH